MCQIEEKAAKPKKGRRWWCVSGKCISMFLESEGWKVVETPFINSIINYWISVLSVGVTVVHRIDKTLWHHSLRWKILCKTLHRGKKNRCYSQNIYKEKELKIETWHVGWELKERLIKEVNLGSKPEVITLDAWGKSIIVMREENHLRQGSKMGEAWKRSVRWLDCWVKGSLAWNEGNKVTRDQFM